MRFKSLRRRSRRTAVSVGCLAGYLALLMFNSFIFAERAGAESAPSTIHFRSPGGSSIVVPVYVNGSGPFDFVLDTGSTLTIVDPELLQSLKLDVIGGGTRTTLAGKTAMILAEARTVSFGSVTGSKVELGVRDLGGLRRLDPRIRGVLGQNVLKNADYLIDNRKRTIEFDSAGTLLTTLNGERIDTIRVGTPDDRNYGGRAVRVRLGGPTADYCTFLLDSGSDTVVLFSDSPDVGRMMAKQPKLRVLEDDGGHEKFASAYPMKLGVGSNYRDVDVYVAAFNSKGLEVEGLLPIADFSSVYISNSGSFVMFQPKRNRRATTGESVAAAEMKTAGALDCPVADVSMM